MPRKTIIWEQKPFRRLVFFFLVRRKQAALSSRRRLWDTHTPVLFSEAFSTFSMFPGLPLWGSGRLSSLPSVPRRRLMNTNGRIYVFSLILSPFFLRRSRVRKEVCSLRDNRKKVKKYNIIIIRERLE